ncbi:MAG: cellulase family glycosylhydrolase [Oscillospiraceae bacterium]|nr:cellulase family glycosylhydrolase [Oscillospiraceae bacterium]
MNKMIKRLTAIALTAAVMLTAGCRKNAPESSEDSAVTPTTVEAGTSEPSGAVEADPAAKVYIEGSKFMVDGKELWINGVNTPWHHWNDFIGNMDYDFWDQTFEKLASDGINATRIWLNCNGESVVQLRADGSVLKINESHWEDLDKLFEIANKHKVYIMATLSSFDHFKDSGSAERWRTMINTKESADNFAERYVKEFCERYGEQPYLFSIDIMNEPDWVHENSECGQLKWEDLSYFFGKCASVIHETCSTPVTVGMAMIKYNSPNYNGDMISDEYLKELTGLDNSYMDFYSPHFYLWMKQSGMGFPFNVTPEEYGLITDKPCIIGETSNDQEKGYGMSLTEVYQTSYEKGWSGIMVWMQTQDDGSWDCYDLTETATNAMYDLIPEKVDPMGVLTVKD